MNHVSEESKDSAIKTLAIIGFIAALVLGLWITIKVVQFLPSAFRELASIADNLYGKGNSFVVTVEKTVVNSGESVNVAWSPVRDDGTYIFSYQCVDGISAETRNRDGKIISVTCGEHVELSPESDAVEVIFKSEKLRFSDVPFTIAFQEEDSAESLFEKSGVVTVVNASIPLAGARPTTPTKPTVTPDPTPAKPVATTPKPTKPAPAKPTGYTTVPRVITTYPVSDPRGYTDLQVTFLAIGEIKNGVFRQTLSLDEDARGAIRFEVRNVGTKTSGEWKVRTELPLSDEETFTTHDQDGLLPNEYAIMTIAFDGIDEDSDERIKVSVSGGNDSRGGNNSFTKRVNIDN